MRNTGRFRVSDSQGGPQQARYSEGVWVRPCETENVHKSKKFYRTVNNIELWTVTFVCENANSMEVSRSCRRGTLLALAFSILSVSLCIDVQVIARRGIKIAYSELHPVRSSGARQTSSTKPLPIFESQIAAASDICAPILANCVWHEIKSIAYGFHGQK